LQGWGARAGWGWVFLGPWSRSHLKEKKKQEPEPLGIKVKKY